MSVSDEINSLKAQVSELADKLDELETFFIERLSAIEHRIGEVDLGLKPGGKPRIVTEAEMSVGETTRQRYADKLTRARYAEKVGVSVKTVKGWEAAAVVNPTQEQVGKVPVYVFTEDDVQLGNAVREVMRANVGRMDLQQARAEALKTLPRGVAARLRAANRAT